MTLKINKELLIELICWSDADEPFEVVHSQITDTSRWSIQYECIIKNKSTGKFYDASYKEGATEMQDESPFEYVEPDSDGNIELKEVYPYEVTITRYASK